MIKLPNISDFHLRPHLQHYAMVLLGHGSMHKIPFIHSHNMLQWMGLVLLGLLWAGVRLKIMKGEKNCLDEKYLQTLVLLELGKCDAMHLFFKDMIGLLLKLLTYVVLLVLTLYFETPSVLAYPSYPFCPSSTRLGKKNLSPSLHGWAGTKAGFHSLSPY